jgi:hypothetical protein
MIFMGVSSPASALNGEFSHHQPAKTSDLMRGLMKLAPCIGVK